MQEQSVFVTFTGKINRRLPQDSDNLGDPVLRYNWLSRDGRLKKPPGHTARITDLSDIARFMGRYYSQETGVDSPKTFTYTEDGVLWVLDDQAQTSTVVKNLLNTNANPKMWLFKTVKQTKMFLVDGARLFSFDGNNANNFQTVSLADADGNSVHPIDLIEHRDRLFVISRTSVFISKNLEPDNFTDADDSAELIIGSGKGLNLAMGKIEDKLYFFNTEGIFVLDGDVISALAPTFEIRLVDSRRIIAGGTVANVENALVFMADDYELWSWDGNQTKMLSYELKLKDFVNEYQLPLSKAKAIYHDNYYKMSFVERGSVEPNIEIWWDAFEDKLDMVKGRHVSCYMKTDATVEPEYLQMGQSNGSVIVQEGIGYDFNGVAITTRLRSRDITVKKGMNVRFTAFYPEFEPSGDRNMVVVYLLDGRSSNPDPNVDVEFTQNLRGEVIILGTAGITNQAQAIGRVRPKINYARGQSIAFEIIEQTDNQKTNLLGIGIDFIVKEKFKGHVLSTPPTTRFMLNEDGTFMLNEDGTRMVLENAT